MIILRQLNQLKWLALFSLIGGIILCSGCRREFSRQALDQKRLGVYLKTEKGDRETLNNALTAGLGQTLTTTEVTAIPLADWNGATQESFLKIRQAYQLDYLLVVNLTAIKVGVTPQIDLTNNSFSLKLGAKCELRLGYRLVDLHSQAVLLTGQTSGLAKNYHDLQIDLKQIVNNLNASAQERIIAAAMLAAVQNSALLK
jgi:hypothetical protein